MGDPSRTLGKKTGLPLHFHLWATFTVRQTLRIQFSNSTGVINNSGTELGQKIKVKYDMNDLVSYHLHWPPPTRTCGLRNSIFRALHMCIGADLNQDHFSRPRFSITHAKPWTLLFLSAPSFVFLLSWPPKKKKALFSTVSLNGVGGGSSFERKKSKRKKAWKNIRQSLLMVEWRAKLINLLSSRFWLWREHISAFTTAGRTSKCEGRTFPLHKRGHFSFILENPSTIPLPSLASSDGVKIYWTGYGQQTFSAYTQQWTYECRGFAYKLTISLVTHKVFKTQWLYLKEKILLRTKNVM